MSISSSQRCNTCLNNLVCHRKLITSNISSTTTTATSAYTTAIAATIPTTNILGSNT
jgi:hypothetical protein